MSDTPTSQHRDLVPTDFGERASLRSWLYRIAMNRCLNWLRSANRRTTVEAARLRAEPPEPTRLGEVTRLEPYPATHLDGVP